VFVFVRVLTRQQVGQPSRIKSRNRLDNRSDGHPISKEVRCMFRKVLIANRGTAAVRIAKTLRRMGIPSVAVYTKADQDSLHVDLADEAVLIGDGPAGDSYLNADRILQAARDTGADAIHPGYGFLSENAAFARRCREAGIAFIGPEPEQIEWFGL